MGACAAGLLVCSQSAKSTADVPYPGLPDQAREGSTKGGWMGIVQTGMAEVSRAKQAVRIPLATAAAWNFNDRTTYPPGHVPTDETVMGNVAFLVSPKGSRNTYGDMPPFTVRTVAFGAIPVQATIQISQRRNAADEPIGIELVSFVEKFSGKAEEFYHDVTVKDALWVTVLDLRIDGVRIPLTGTCRTSEPAPLNLLGKGGGFQTNLTLDLTKYYRAAPGGRLAGTMDIPAFSGCTTASDDLSELLTASVSGTGNPVKLNVSGAVCFTNIDGVTYPPPPGATTAEAANCIANRIPDELPYPQRR